MRAVVLGVVLALFSTIPGCASTRTPPTTTTPSAISDAVVTDAFDRDGGPWLAQRVRLCGFCGPDGPRQLFVVFADGRLLHVDATTNQNDSMTRGAGVTYDADELRALLEPENGHAFHIFHVVTARLDDRREIGVLGQLWDPRPPKAGSCADYAASWRYAPGSPARFDATCPVQPGDPMDAFATAMAKLENQTREVGSPQGSVGK